MSTNDERPGEVDDAEKSSAETRHRPHRDRVGSRAGRQGGRPARRGSRPRSRGARSAPAHRRRLRQLPQALAPRARGRAKARPRRAAQGALAGLRQPRARRCPAPSSATDVKAVADGLEHGASKQFADTLGRIGISASPRSATRSTRRSTRPSSRSRPTSTRPGTVVAEVQPATCRATADPGRHGRRRQAPKPDGEGDTDDVTRRK